jgi:hypothetical protein
MMTDPRSDELKLRRVCDACVRTGQDEGAVFGRAMGHMSKRKKREMEAQLLAVMEAMGTTAPHPPTHTVPCVGLVAVSA